VDLVALIVNECLAILGLVPHLSVDTEDFLVDQSMLLQQVPQQLLRVALRGVASFECLLVREDLALGQLVGK